MSYGLLLWGRAADIGSVFVLQKRAIRAIYKMKCQDSLKEKFKEINILTVPCEFIYQVIRYVRKNVETLPKLGERHAIETRNKHKLTFPKVRLNKPKAVFFTCMDSRMIPTRFTETSVGDMFVVRNAGNVVPHSQHFADEMTSCEPAALELGCIINDIRHIIVCGHSDCKAMNLLYKLKSPQESCVEQRRISPLKSWLCTHSQSSLNKFLAMNGDFTMPMIFTAETAQRKFAAYIDPENNFCVEDKLSQVNTLQQLQNVASYGMLKKRLEKHDLHIHALWFDIYTGDIYYFSRRAKRFVIIDESTYETILAEVRRYYS